MYAYVNGTPANNCAEPLIHGASRPPELNRDARNSAPQRTLRNCTSTDMSPILTLYLGIYVYHLLHWYVSYTRAPPSTCEKLRYGCPHTYR